MSLELGSPVPDFTLADVVHGREIALDDGSGAAGVLLMFICNHCPFVIHVREEFQRLMDDFGSLGLRIIAINSNDVNLYPQDGPGPMKALAQELGWTFSYCLDPDQSVARAYAAACTPDFFLMDGALRLFYRGQLDGSRPGNDVPVTALDLRAAIDDLLAGRPAPIVQTPSIGCNIKWTPGQEPG
jgi:peroxiredoxin